MPATSDRNRAVGPLRVAYVAHTMARGGSASSLSLLLANMPPGAVAAHLIAPAGPAREDFERLGVTVHDIPGVASIDSLAGAPLRGRRLLTLLRATWNARHGWRLRRLLELIDPDVVHINERGMLAAAVVASRAGFPVVMHARSVSDRRTRWVKRLSDAVYTRHVDRLIAIDESVRQSLREVPHVDVVYNPLRPLPPQPVSRQATGQVRFTFLSGLLPVKGVWDLLQAAALLGDRRDILVQIAGSNPRPREYYASLAGKLTRLIGVTPDLEQDVRQWIARHGLEGSVKLMGHVEPTDLLANTDVLVFPSHLNGPGRSVFEAGALGIPSIVALRDRIQDVVTDGETGLIVSEADPATLAAAMRALADDAELRARLGAKARERYLQLFDPVASAHGVLAVYRDVLAARGTP